MKNKTYKSVLVTGASGSLGSAIICKLDSNEQQIFALYRDTKHMKANENSSVVRIVQDSAEWPTIIEKLKPEVLILCDWQGVAGSERDDIQLQKNNISRWSLMIDAAILSGVSRIIAFGSQAEISKEQKNVPPDVDFSPRSAYGDAKSVAFQLLKTKCATAEIDFDWLRIFSLYGDESDTRWLIPKVIKALAEGSPAPLTSCEQVWNFLHVDDAASAVETILENSAKNGITNLAHPESHRIRDVVDFIGDRMNRIELLKYGAIASPSDLVMHMEPNVKDLTSLGWSPKIDLFESLEELISRALNKI